MNKRPGTSPQGKYVLCSGLATVWPCPHCCNMRLVFSGLHVSSVPKLELWGCMGGFQFKLPEAMLRLGHCPPGQVSYNIKPGGMYYIIWHLVWEDMEVFEGADPQGQTWRVVHGRENQLWCSFAETFLKTTLGVNIAIIRAGWRGQQKAGRS